MINWSLVTVGARLLMSPRVITTSNDSAVREFFENYAGKYVTYWSSQGSNNIEVRELRGHTLPKSIFVFVLNENSFVRVWNSGTRFDGYVVKVIIQKPNGKWEVVFDEFSGSAIFDEDNLFPIELRIGDGVQFIDNPDVVGTVNKVSKNGAFNVRTTNGDIYSYNADQLGKVILTEMAGKKSIVVEKKEPAGVVEDKRVEVLEEALEDVVDDSVQEKTDFELPKNTLLWMQNMVSGIQGGRRSMFVLEGNIYDLVPYGENFVELEESFEKLFAHYDYILSYNIVSGLKIVKADDRQLLKDLEFTGNEQQNLEGLRLGRTEQSDPASLFPRFQKLLERKDRKTLLTFDYAETIVDGKNTFCSVTFKQWARNRQIKDSNNVVMLITRYSADLDRTLLDPMLGMQLVKILKPDTERRLAYLQQFDCQYLDDQLLHQVAILTNGLGYRHLQELVNSFESVDEVLMKVKFMKLSFLEQEYGDLFTIVNNEDGLETVGGMEMLKREAEYINRNIRRGHFHKVPRGIMFVGPPGTGKTKFFTSWAADLIGYNAVIPNDPRGKYVGDSEKNMRKQRQALEEMEPVFVFRDEIDQEGGRGEGGDSGVNSRIFKAWLDIMNEPSYRGRIVVFMATNRPDLVDMAMTRSGRSDLRLAVIYPTEEARNKIFEAIVRSMVKKGQMKCRVKDFSVMSQKTDGRTGADIATMITMAGNIADRDDRVYVQERDFLAAIDDFRPTTISQDQIDKSTLMAINDVSGDSLLPDGWQEAIRRVHKRRAFIRDPQLSDLLEKLMIELKEFESEEGK